MLTQRNLPCKCRIEHASKAESARRERPHTVQHVRERDRCRRARVRRSRRGGGGQRGGEGSEGLWGDGQYGDAVSWRSWTGVRCEDGEDFGVGLEGDQDGFCGGDTPAVWDSDEP